MPYFEKTDSKEGICCPNWKIYNGRRKVCVNFKYDADKLNIVVYRHRKSLYLKDNEVDSLMRAYQSLMVKLVYLLSNIDISYKRCMVLDERTVHK